MESFVYDSLMADKTPLAVCVLCKDGRSREIKEALSALDAMEFGKYRSAYTIDYRLSDILKTLLSPFKDDGGSGLSHGRPAWHNGRRVCIG